MNVRRSETFEFLLQVAVLLVVIGKVELDKRCMCKGTYEIISKVEQSTKRRYGMNCDVTNERFELKRGKYDDFRRVLCELAGEKPVFMAKVRPALQVWGFEFVGKLRDGIQRVEGVTVKYDERESNPVGFLVLESRQNDSAYLSQEPRFVLKSSCKDDGYSFPRKQKLAVNAGEYTRYVGILRWISDPTDVHNVSGEFKVPMALHSDGNVKDVVLHKSRPYNCFRDGDFVFGFSSDSESNVWFNNNPVNSAVQVVLWSIFGEASQQSDALKFFSEKKGNVGKITTRHTSLLGNSDVPGNLVVYDERHKVYLKGFLSYGGGVVEYRDVAASRESIGIQIRDHINIYNFDYVGNQFSIFCPRKGNRYSKENKHAVLDWEGWKPLETMDDSGIKMGELIDFAKIASAASSLEFGGKKEGGDENSPEGESVDSMRITSESLSPEIDSKKNAEYGNPQEIHFLKSLIADAKKCGFIYNPQDIVRFHTCVKMGMFTLLGGAPGGGKSSLAALYARAIQGGKCDEEKHGFLAIDVNPAWMEPADILGYWNLKNEFSCAQSGLVPFLRDALDLEKPSFVCLEEMNLARPEHYFSDFIQMMSREGDKRILCGVPRSSGGGREDAKLPVSENVRFIGTVNFDETTQRFSERFYDRCNYIELQSCDHEPFSGTRPSFAHGTFDCGVSKDEYKSWVREVGEADKLEDAVVDKYKDVRSALNNLNMLPSHRVEQVIHEYILNRPFLDDCGSSPSSSADRQLVALDEAIAQRVLSRCNFGCFHSDQERGYLEALAGKLKDNGMKLSREFFERRRCVGVGLDVI